MHLCNFARKKCINKCYYERQSKRLFVVRVFEEEFSYQLGIKSDEYTEKIKLKIQQRIEYWKKDLRYVTKIFEGRK